MASSSSDVAASLATQILALLTANPSMRAAELEAATGKSQPSISLAINALGERVCRMGAARSTRYALARDILGLSATQVLHMTDEAGLIAPFGTLTQLQSGQIHVRADKTKREWLSKSGELPWFLKPLRPQGFLGRQYVRVRPDFPADPDMWTAEQALYIAANHASDQPGAFGVGEITGRFIPEAPTELQARAKHYDGLAQLVNVTLPAGSSAGGEQPKFLSEIYDKNGYHHLIVKFSPPHDTPFGARWRALLYLEHLAHDTLRAHGIPAAHTNIVESAGDKNGRTYLESRRFDRVGMEGKRHVVAIDALHDEFVAGPRKNWLHSAEGLFNNKLITEDALRIVAHIYAFGQFIGNTDMHYGNLSFFVDDITKPRIALAPVYDMLPMMWRPSVHSGELDATPAQVQSVNTTFRFETRRAREWAIAFWTRAAELNALDNPLKKAAEESAVRLKALV
jgi:hypothetical protein